MTKNETTYRKAAQKLTGLRERRDELWTQGEIAKSDLADYRKKSAKDLIGGADGESIASELAKREAKVRMFAGAVRRWARY
tara:strand:- start:385 stop:627 length:243 start_codon:yes stop_codon:yes gene_type:complete